MMKSSRQLENLYRFFLHALSLVFAYFLLEGGSLIIKYLPEVSVQQTVEDYTDEKAVEEIEELVEEVNSELEMLSLEKIEIQAKISGIKKIIALEKEKFRNALSSRYVTESKKGNRGVESAKKKLEEEQGNLRKISQELNEVNNRIALKETEKGKLNQHRNELVNEARKALKKEKDLNVLKAFSIRLLFVLPLLLVSFLLFRKYRKSNNWPFVHGLGYFSIYAFFIELVPYFPSYGGYVRALVGIALALVVGKFAIHRLQVYLQQKRELERENEKDKRTKLQSKETDLEKTFEKIARQICPSCDRKFTNGEDKFCVYCGLCLKTDCAKCGQLQNSFNQFCFECGTGLSHSSAQK